MSRRLVLFDIDGTLLITGGAGSRSIRRALVEMFGPSIRWGGVEPGTPDPLIYRALLEYNGRLDALDRHEEYRRRYLALLAGELERCAAEVRVLPGVGQVLSRLDRCADVAVGLLSGNYPEAAAMKLKAAGLDRRHFEVAALAEDDSPREAMLRRAVAAFARREGAAVAPASVITVGDTPRDAACAAACGHRCLAVATGMYGPDALREAGADRVVNDLTDPAPLLELLNGGPR